MILLIFLLVVVLVACLYFALSVQDEAKIRVASVKREGAEALSAAAVIAARRKNVQAVLRGIDNRQKNETSPRVTLRQRLDRAGFTDTPVRQFWLVSLFCGAVALVLCLVAEKSILMTVFVLFTAVFGLPHWGLLFLVRRRQKRFTDEFANAIDVIVRSVRSGLPSFEALKLVGREFPDPVGGEFQRLVDGMMVGLTLEQVLDRMFASMPTAEVGFFSVVMTVQQRSGGNLAEALSNLAAVLRDRRRLRSRIKSMSSEAKATAWIIGSLPVAVILMLYVISPDYISQLFVDHFGNILLAACVGWMALGAFIMHQMINFKH